MDQIRELLGLSADASLDDVLAAVTEENKGGLTEGLGLPPEATLEEVKAAITELATPAAEEAVTVAARRKTVATIAQKLGLGAVADVAALVAAVTTRLGREGGTTSVLKQQVNELETQVEALRTANALAEFNAAINSPAHAGKISPDDQPKYFALFRGDREMFATVLANTRSKVRDQSLFTGRAGNAGAGDAEQTEADWKAEYAKSSVLQREFGGEATYVAFCRANASGQVNANVSRLKDAQKV